MNVRLKSETSTTVTWEWDPISGLRGFRYTRPDGKVSHTWDGALTEVRFAKMNGEYLIEPLRVSDAGRATYPVVVTPPGQFGSALPARLPKVGGQPLNGGAKTISQGGTASNPLTFVGGTVTGQVNIHGARYVRLVGVDISGGRDGVNILNSQDIEIDGCYIHGHLNQNVLAFGPSTRNIQLWNLKCRDTGFQPGTVDTAYNHHNVYFADGDDCVVANCDLGDASGSGIQLNPNTTNLSNFIITCNTLRAGPRSKIGLVLENLQSMQNIVVVGLTIEDAEAAAVWTAGGTNSGVVVYDSMRWNSAGFGAGPTYVNCVTANPDTAAKGFVQAARHKWVPPTDIAGKPRVTADAGAFAL